MTLLRPLLAAKTTDEDLKRLRYPMLLSPKIDGVRALVVNGQLVSRSMKPIRNYHTQALFGRPELEGLDGELVVGNPWDKNLMQQTTSGVMSYEGKPDVKFYVFDRWDMGGTFHDRWKSLDEYGVLARKAGINRGSNIYRVSHRLCISYEQLLEQEADALKTGYEGVMLRDLQGPYKQNRSTVREGILLKVKRFHDSEAIILDSSPLLRNCNSEQLDARGYTKRSSSVEGKVADDLLGSLSVRDYYTGVTFDIGSGFSEQLRRSLWADRAGLKGRVIKYKSFNIGVKEKPRFPIFLGFRDLEDM